ncbi:MAG TPA: glutathione S-transferase family protein [Sandaracinaceae bacterium LLY-WYZ-13_1]|nr:glutathione S-transferase family protein [Sandaracinaceae bacterium LLY-WYZ-13_1]
MTHYRLVSFALCPFVQRSVITLNEKRVPHEIEYISLSDKPDWFLEMSPLGKVPVLVVDDETVLFESAVINEYLDEVTEGRMLPEDPLERARGRAWIELASSLIGAAYRLQIAKDAPSASEARAKVRDLLGKLEGALPEDGPFFYGVELSLVDCATAPALQRLTWIEDLDAELGLFESFEKVRRWRDALMARESVRKSTVEDIVDRFRDSVRRNESWIARAA